MVEKEGISFDWAYNSGNTVFTTTSWIPNTIWCNTVGSDLYITNLSYDKNWDYIYITAKYIAQEGREVTLSVPNDGKIHKYGIFNIAQLLGISDISFDIYFKPIYSNTEYPTVKIDYKFLYTKYSTAPRLIFPYSIPKEETYDKVYLNKLNTERLGYTFYYVNPDDPDDNNEKSLRLLQDNWSEMKCSITINFYNIGALSTQNNADCFSSIKPTKNILIKFSEDIIKKIKNSSYYIEQKPNWVRMGYLYPRPPIGQSTWEATFSNLFYYEDNVLPPVTEKGELVKYPSSEEINFKKFLDNYKYLNSNLDYPLENQQQGKVIKVNFWKDKCNAINISYVNKMYDWLHEDNNNIDNSIYWSPAKLEINQGDLIATKDVPATHRYLNLAGLTHKQLNKYTHKQISTIVGKTDNLKSNYYNIIESLNRDPTVYLSAWDDFYLVEMDNKLLNTL